LSVKDRRDPGAQPLTLVERAVADPHAGHVDQRVVPAGLEATDGVTQLTKASAHGGAAL
jgi:hypothetical protein